MNGLDKIGADASGLVRIGMHAAIRDLHDWVSAYEWTDRHNQRVVDASHLRAYLLSCLVTAGGYDDGES